MLIPCVVTVPADWVDKVEFFVEIFGGRLRDVAAWADGAKRAARATTVNRDTITLNFFN